MTKVPSKASVDWCARVERLRREAGDRLDDVEIDPPQPLPSWVERVIVRDATPAEVYVDWSAERTVGQVTVEAHAGRSVYTRDYTYSHGAVHQGDMEPAQPLTIDLGESRELTPAEAFDIHAALGQLLEHMAANGMSR